MGRLVGAVILCFAGFGGCAGDARTQVVFCVYVDPASLDRADELRIEVTARSGEVIAPISVSLADKDSVLPVARLPISPEGELDDRPLTVRLTLLEANALLARQDIPARFEADQLLSVRARFSDECLGVLCGSGENCLAGECQPIAERSVRVDNGASLEGVCPADETGCPAECGECNPCRAGECAPVAVGTACGACNEDSCDAEGSCVSSVVIRNVSAGGWHTCGTVEIDPNQDAASLFCWGTTGTASSAWGTGKCGSNPPK